MRPRPPVQLSFEEFVNFISMVDRDGSTTDSSSAGDPDGFPFTLIVNRCACSDAVKGSPCSCRLDQIAIAAIGSRGWSTPTTQSMEMHQSSNPSPSQERMLIARGGHHLAPSAQASKDRRLNPPVRLFQHPSEAHLAGYVRQREQKSTTHKYARHRSSICPGARRAQ